MEKFQVPNKYVTEDTEENHTNLIVKKVISLQV